MSYRKKITSVISIAVILMTSFCTHGKRVERTKKKLSHTIEDYWNAKISRDWDVIQKIESGKEEKGTQTPLTRRTNFNIYIKTFKIEDISFDADFTKAKVDVSYTYTIPILPNELYKMDVSEWIYQKGKWYVNSPLRRFKTDRGNTDTVD